MKKIYIVYSYTGTIFSTILRHFTNDQYIHISICLDRKFKKVYSFGRINPRWMFPCGFAHEDYNRITKVSKNTRCQLYELEINSFNYYRLKFLLKKYINNRKSYRYNIRGLLHIYFNKEYQRDNHFVCSQFVGKLLMDSGIYDFNKDYSIIKPKDIISIPDLKLIYEGKVIELLKNIDKYKN